MSVYIANADGPWATVGTWDKVVNAPTQHATTNITPTTGGVPSVTFTAPNTTNASIGCLILPTTVVAGRTWTATLQEDTGAGFASVAGATSTVSTNLMTANVPVNFVWGTPHVWGTSTANKCRILLQCSVTSSGTCAADSGGANFMFLASNDQHAEPVDGDRVWIGPANQAGTRTVTVTGITGAVGDATASVTPAARSIVEAIYIWGVTNGGSEGLLKWDTTASSTLTVKGNFFVTKGGERQMGTSTSRMPAAYVATLIYNPNGVAGTAGGRFINGGINRIHGPKKSDETHFHTTYASGSGTSGGMYGGGITLGGTADAYSMTDGADFHPAGNFSVMAVFRTTSTTATQGLFQTYSANTNVAGILFQLNNTGVVKFQSGKNTGPVSGTDFQAKTGAINCADGALHKVIGVYDGSKLHIYVDGTEDGTGTNWANAAAFAATNYIRIGCQNGSGSNVSWFKGLLDEVAFFPADALSQAEVTTLQTNELITQAAILAKAKFYARYESGALTTDSSTGGHTQTAIGGPKESGSLVLASDISLAANDEITVTGSTYDHIEYKFVKTVVSPNHYILSDTAGGAESGLAYAHAVTDEVLNIERNCIITSSSTTLGWWEDSQNSIAGCGQDIDWAKFKYCGSSVSLKNGFYVGSSGASTTTINQIDYTVVELPLYHGIMFYYGVTGRIYTGCISVKSNTSQQSATGGLYFYSFGNNFNELYAIGQYSAGLYVNGLIGVVMTDCHIWGCDIRNSNAGGNAGLGMGNEGNVNWVRLEVHACRQYGIQTSTIDTQVTFLNCLIGTKGANVVGPVFAYNNTFQDIVFNTCSFDADPPILNYLTLGNGSKIKIQNMNGTANKHRWYAAEGVGQNTGAGLTDQTVYTAGTFCVRLSSENATLARLEWSFDQPLGDVTVNADKTIQVSVWCRIEKEAYWAGTTYELPRLTLNYDNGTIAYFQATTIAADSASEASKPAAARGWQKLFIVLDPVTSYAQATITCSAKTDATGGNQYVYFASRSFTYPAGYVFETGQNKFWANGQPLPAVIANSVTAQDIASLDITHDYGSNSLGNKINSQKNASLLIKGKIIV